jgi:hypothetical protein
MGSNFAKIEKKPNEKLSIQIKASNILKILIKKNSNVNTWVVFS